MLPSTLQNVFVHSSVYLPKLQNVFVQIKKKTFVHSWQPIVEFDGPVLHRICSLCIINYFGSTLRGEPLDNWKLYNSHYETILILYILKGVEHMFVQPLKFKL